MCSVAKVHQMPRPKAAPVVTLACSPCLIAGIQTAATYQELSTNRLFCTAHLLEYEIPLHKARRLEMRPSTVGVMPTVAAEYQNDLAAGRTPHCRLCKQCGRNQLSGRNKSGICIECQKQRHSSGALCPRCGERFIHRDNDKGMCTRCSRRNRKMRPQDKPKCRRCGINAIGRCNRSGVCAVCKPYLPSLPPHIARTAPVRRPRKKAARKKRRRK